MKQEEKDYNTTRAPTLSPKVFGYYITKAAILKIPLKARRYFT